MVGLWYGTQLRYFEGYTLPYSRKIWRGIKFGGLAVYYYNRQIKIHQNFLLAYIRMAIPYRTAKFQSANILSIAILGSTAKFNARQYFRLYGIFTRIGHYNSDITLKLLCENNFIAMAATKLCVFANVALYSSYTNIILFLITKFLDLRPRCMREGYNSHSVCVSVCLLSS